MPQQLRIERSFPLALGGSLPSVQIAYEQWGDPGAGPDRTVLVLPALSASAHVASSEDNPEPGWWDGIVGPGKGIDTNHWRVLCASILGSPYGSTSPLSTNPDTGRVWGCDFPQITPADQARLHAWLLEALGLDRVHAVVGSSLGGMQTLQFAAHFPRKLNRWISISATGKTTPGTVALRRVGRCAIVTDPDFRDGRYEPGHGPVRGLAVARELGTITYRSRDEFNRRFRWEPDGETAARGLAFEVERYLEAHGRRFAHRFDANCYLLLSRCMDLMDLGAGFPAYADGVKRISTSGFIMGVNHDMLIPAAEQQHLAHLLESLGRPVRFEVLPSEFGHDAFLKEDAWFGPRIAEFLAETTV